jgi:hypothetical protein
MTPKQAKNRLVLNIMQTPRAAMGWPCFYCGRRMAVCKAKKCCARCEGKRSH